MASKPKAQEKSKKPDKNIGTHFTGNLTPDEFMEQYFGGIDKDSGEEGTLLAVLDLKPGKGTSEDADDDR